jgi:hypothetical protein
VAFVTVSGADPVTELNGGVGLIVVALIVVVPGAFAVARPCVPELLLTVATPGDEEFHITSCVMSREVPSLK